MFSLAEYACHENTPPNKLREAIEERSKEIEQIEQIKKLF